MFRSSVQRKLRLHRALSSYRVTCFLLIVILLMLLTLWVENNTLEDDSSYLIVNATQIDEGKKCFQIPKSFSMENIMLLDDILTAKVQPDHGRSIFLHETSCFMNGVINMTARQACAVESAAMLNPNRKIFVLFASPVGFVKSQKESPIIKALQSYPNIHFRNVDLKSYAAGTPIDGFYETGRLFLSEYVVSHTSDYLRYLSLFRYGGIHLDLDVVVQKNLDVLPPNFAGAQNEVTVAVGAMGFQHDPVAHFLLKLCARDFAVNFRGKIWHQNGPGVLTRILLRVCQVDKISEMTPEKCWGFKVFPPKELYAIHWKKWEYFFDKSKTKETLDTIKDSSVVHMWNKLSSNATILKSDPRTAYEVIAMKYCPKVFDASGEYF